MKIFSEPPGATAYVGDLFIYLFPSSHVNEILKKPTFFAYVHMNYYMVCMYIQGFHKNMGPQTRLGTQGLSQEEVGGGCGLTLERRRRQFTWLEDGKANI